MKSSWVDGAGRLAREFVSWLEVPVSGHWLDVGTGTGAVAEAICAVASLALNFFPHPGAAVEEQLELTSAEGVVAACVWDYAGEMQFLRYFWDAATRVDPKAAELDEGQRFPLCAPDALERLFDEAVAGLSEPLLSSY